MVERLTEAAPVIVHGYDDEEVTLGDGTISIDGVLVRGSRTFRRDPRLRSVPREFKRGRTVQTFRVPAGAKWCSDCGEWVERDQFSPDRRYRDGKRAVCNPCRARHKRALYAAQKHAQGATVRPYTRRT